MLNGKGMIPVYLALFVLISCTTLHHKNSDEKSLQSPQLTSVWIESTEDTKLRLGNGDPDIGRNKAELCFGCHGEDGNSLDPQAPKLAGQYGVYIAKQLNNYLSRMRSHQIMSNIAATLNEGDFDDIAAYFASQPMMKGDVTSGNKIGKKLFEIDDMSKMQVSCSSCHGITGKGQHPSNPAYPVIGGQHKSYLLTQLLKFKNGARNNSAGGIMNVTVHNLNDAELEALADYVSGL